MTTAPVTADTTGTPTPIAAQRSTTLDGPSVVGLEEAARLCKVSVATVRLRRNLLEAAGATAAGDGWTIPIPALVAVGLLDRSTPPRVGAVAGAAPGTTPCPAPVVDTPESPVLASLREELDAERRARAAAEARAHLAEAVSEERGRALEDTRLALRALTTSLSVLLPGPAAAPPRHRATNGRP